jgi:hypothetical protein
MPIPKVVVTAALMAANVAMSMSRTIEGPRLDDTKITTGDYGSPLNNLWGLRRLIPAIFFAEDLREVKQQRKTKGGKFNDYTYYGTWAVAVAGHEIAAIRRIWFDTHLVFDLSGAGPVTPFDFGGEAGNSKSGGAGAAFSTENIAIYLGTETQEPDPRILATTEERNGEGTCPAYRGTAYIVFKDVPLEKLGNRIPQVSVEAVSAPDALFPVETIDTNIDAPFRLRNIAYTNDYSRFMWTSTASEYEIFDVAARASMISGPAPDLDDQHSGLGMYADGSWLACTESFSDVRLLQFDPDGTGSTEIIDFGALPERQDDVWVLTDGNGVEHWLSRPYLTFTPFFVDGVEFNLSTITGIANLQPKGYFVDLFGDIWAFASRAVSNQTTAYFYRVIDCGQRGGPSFVTVTGLANRTSGTDEFDHDYAGVTHYQDTALDQFVFYWAGNLYAVDATTGAINASQTSLSINEETIGKNLRWCPLGSGTVWIYASNAVEVSLKDLSVVRSYSLGISGPWGDVSNDSDSGVLYCPTLHALIAPHASLDKIQFLYLDRVGSATVTLGSIVADVSDRVGITEYDFTDLDQEVIGWSATNGPASNMIEPLLDAYDSDIRPHDFAIEGIKRTGVTTGSTLLTERFVEGQPRYSVRLQEAPELPRALTFNFADIDADQQPNNARADRPLDATGSRSEQTIDLATLALGKDEARGLAERYFRRVWNQRVQVTNALTAQELALEPGDVRTLSLDGETLTARLVRLKIGANETLECEWRYDHPSLALLSGANGAGFDGRNPAVIVVPLTSKGFALDIPLLADGDNSVNPVMYFAAAPYAAGTWPGATFYQQTGGEYTDEAASIPSSSIANWGYATDVLADANPNLWDRGGSVNVLLQYGTLTGCTEADINARPTLNLALLGDEIVNFTTATLEGDGSYTLSGFKRGRRGTEWATGTHAVRDVFLLLDTAEPDDLGLSDVSTNLSFKAVTQGRTATSAFPIAVAPFTGASLKPYAPCQLREVRDSGSGDWALSWTRRTRVGGAWTGGSAIPLSEASEEYEVEIMNGGTVVRTVTGLTSPSYTYSSANQTTDFGAPQTSLSWRVYQVSDAVGRGFVASA